MSIHHASHSALIDARVPVAGAPLATTGVPVAAASAPADDDFANALDAAISGAGSRHGAASHRGDRWAGLLGGHLLPGRS
ncbi:MAG: hypothetical protein S0880_10535 [Actinomycetota bacterium]|nr:hypothetical protein [Actinomycetota bacterium]